MKYKIFILLSSALLLAAQAQAYTDISIYTQPSQPVVNDPVKIFVQLTGFAPPPSLPVFIMNASVMLYVDGVKVGSNKTDKGGTAIFGYSFKTSGERNLTAYYTGDAGYDPANKSILLKVLPGGLPPIAIAFTNHTKNNVGSPAYLNASKSYDTDGFITKYEWDLGDGNKTTGIAPKYTYTKYRWNGIVYSPFTVNLTVTDNMNATNSTGIPITTFIAGDANGDGKVSILDMAKIGLSWNTKYGDAMYDDGADLNNDNVVNILDATIVGLNWNRKAEINV